MTREYEVERTTTREKVATALRRLADGVAGGSVRVDAEDGPVAVDVPEDVEFEVELTGEGEEVELEAELEWDAEGGEAISELDQAAAPADDPVGPADEAESDARFELYQDSADEWRWRLRHTNGNIIADSGEGYTRRADAVNGLESVKSNAPLAVVEEVDE